MKPSNTEWLTVDDRSTNSSRSDDDRPGEPLISSPQRALSTGSRPPVRFWSGRRVWKWMLVAVLAAGVFLGPKLWKVGFHHRAEQALQRHDTTEAMKNLEWADALGKPTARTALMKARCARRAGQVVSFQAFLKEAETRGATPLSIQREALLFAAQSGQMQRAAPHLAALLTDTSGDNKDVCFAYVTGYLRSQRVDDALVLLEAWKQDAPQDPLPWLIRGRIKRFRQNYAEAESDLQHSLKLQPDNPEALVELAELLSDGNRLAEARTLFEQVLSQQQFRARAVTGLARCLKSLGEFSSALELLTTEAVNLSSEPSVWLELGRLQFENSNFEQALASLQQAVNLQPWNDEAMYLQAQCLNQLDRQQEAAALMATVDQHRAALAKLEIIKDGLRKDPASVELLLRAGELLLKFSNPEEAAITLQSALDVDPNLSEAHKLLADYYQNHAQASDYQESMLQWHRQRSQR